MGGSRDVGGEVAREGGGFEGGEGREYVCSREAELATLSVLYDLKRSRSWRGVVVGCAAVFVFNCIHAIQVRLRTGHITS
jgi:hypothetical protein